MERARIKGRVRNGNRHGRFCSSSNSRNNIDHDDDDDDVHKQSGINGAVGSRFDGRCVVEHSARRRRLSINLARSETSVNEKIAEPAGEKSRRTVTNYRD